MKIYDDITPALKAILFHFIRGYTVWTSFIVPIEKLEGIASKWAEAYGTQLPAWKRQDRKEKKLATAVALAAPVISRPGMRQVMLMATEHALTMPKASDWAREQWLTRLPEFSEFVMVHEPREGAEYAWSWRIQERVLDGLQRHLVALVKAGDVGQLKHETTHLVQLYPLYGGVRRQIRRMYRGAAKLWTATRKSNWPGPDPERLPMMIGFRKDPGVVAGAKRAGEFLIFDGR
ncbi:hypothetical protein [Ferrovum sp.]|uniref:hypothetical protein n=1 Tax=Ferrovum sp. TaxID=2609467 RepID=UPI002610F6A9|nr:hypothetical protein [Ferrovum sp.]